MFKARPLPKTISTNIETDPAPFRLANEKEQETTKYCVPSQSIHKDIPVTHTITFGVKPLETMNDEMKNTITTNKVPPESHKLPSRKYVDKKKRKVDSDGGLVSINCFSSFISFYTQHMMMTSTV